MTTITTLTLPIPPSVNSMYRRGYNGVYKTQAAQNYTDEVWVACYAAGIQEPTSANVALLINFYPSNSRSDLDNILKSLLDSLEKVAYANDNQVVRIQAEKHSVDRYHPRIEVTIHKLD